MNLFLISVTAGASFLLSFLLFFHPLQQNVKANRWLGFFAFIAGCAFTSTYMISTGVSSSHLLLFKVLNSLQFLLAPSLYISILCFTKPAKQFSWIDLLHFIPFVVYSCIEIIVQWDKESISTIPLFEINKNVSFLVRDLLPFLTIIYLVKSYLLLRKHKANLKYISSSIEQIDLSWLVQFLFILSLSIIIWVNDALFELPFITEATPFAYAGLIFFLAYFSIKQKTIFAFPEKDIPEISAVLTTDNKTTAPEPESLPETEQPETTTANGETTAETIQDKSKQKRLTEEQLTVLAEKLISLMEKEKLYLDNELNLTTVAERLGIGIHDTSYLINKTANDNFYNFINKYRVEEAKQLLTSDKMASLNILGIAFAAGFNSKTAFNTAFKKWTGQSPSSYIKARKNQ